MRGMERDKQKGKHYWELGAIGGNTNARYNLGTLEDNRDWGIETLHDRSGIWT